MSQTLKWWWEGGRWDLFAIFFLWISSLLINHPYLFDEVDSRVGDAAFEADFCLLLWVVAEKPVEKLR